VAESDWGIFTACIHEKRALTDVSRSLGLTPSNLREALARVEDQIEPRRVARDGALEALQLSVRAKNALHRLGCETVADVLRLDFNGSIRQLGSKTRSEILDRLDKAGFRMVLPEKPLPSEMRRIARGLDRVQARINSAYESVMREIRQLQGRLEKLGD
jgi:DNA-directed RNA polymerase alpha subunit